MKKTILLSALIAAGIALAPAAYAMDDMKKGDTKSMNKEDTMSKPDNKMETKGMGKDDKMGEKSMNKEGKTDKGAMNDEHKDSMKK
jgi:pentapeptide MXKDX repeat protein